MRLAEYPFVIGSSPSYFLASVGWLSSETVGTSTLIMTSLMGIGLFFFLRASGKDRTETRSYTSHLPLQTAGSQIRHYFAQQSYILTETDKSGVATFVGQGQPSLFLTTFLTGLAAVGLACLALVVQTLKPEWQGASWLLLLGSPLAGLYYHRRAQRQETVRLRLQQRESGEAATVQLKISGHRDELDLLESALQLQEDE